MNVLSLCSGAGGIELGLRLAVGEGVRVVACVERDAYAAAVLVARMEDETLDRAAVFPDLLRFDGRPWRGRVDCITAGFPCQPFSFAGKRRGTADERWIWPDIERIVREVGPRLVFLENVPGLLARRGGFGPVLGSLASLGFDAEWGSFTASEVGAPHKRERVFILAYRSGWDARGAGGGGEASHDSIDVADAGRIGGAGWGERGYVRGAAVAVEGKAQERQWGRNSAGDGSEELADADSRRGQQPKRDDDAWQSDASRVGAEVGDAECCGGPMADAIGSGHDGRASIAERGSVGRTASERAGEGVGDAHRERLSESGTARDTRTGPSDAGGSVGDSNGAGLAVGFDGTARDSCPAAFPPGPLDLAAWKAWIGAGGPEPVVRRGVDGTSPRVDRLRTLGNGVVPDVAALAWRSLMERAGGASALGPEGGRG